MPPCLFCSIANHEINAAVVFEDERIVAFNDINPQAPTHVLIVPRRHIATLNDLTADDHELVGERCTGHLGETREYEVRRSTKLAARGFPLALSFCRRVLVDFQIALGLLRRLFCFFNDLERFFRRGLRGLELLAELL